MRLFYAFALLAVLTAGIAVAAFAQDDMDTRIISAWIRNTALSWVQDRISYSELVVLQWLVDREIIAILAAGDPELVEDLQDEISMLKASIARDIQDAYEEGYADGQQDQKQDRYDDNDLRKTLTVQTNKATYNYADAVTVHGTLYGAPDGTPVVIAVIHNDSEQVIIIMQTNLYRGKFIQTFYTNELLAEYGSYTLEAMYGDLTSSVIFDVVTPDVSIGVNQDP